MAIGDPFNISQYGEILVDEAEDSSLISTYGYLSFDVGAPPITDHTTRGLSLLIEQFRKTYPLGDKGLNE